VKIVLETEHVEEKRHPWAEPHTRIVTLAKESPHLGEEYKCSRDRDSAINQNPNHHERNEGVVLGDRQDSKARYVSPLETLYGA